LYDILQGLIAIILVIITLILRDSDNKWLAYIGWAIFILAKLIH